MKSLLRTYGFEYEHEYFEYIIESRLNGNIKQSRMLYDKLYKGMQDGEHLGFFEYVEQCFPPEYLDELKEFLINKPKTNNEEL
jgi:hypothetical protein